MSLLPDPPNAADGDTLDALRHALESSDFTVEGIEERLGANELSLRPIDTAVLLRRLEEDAFGRWPASFCSALRPTRTDWPPSSHHSSSRGSRMPVCSSFPAGRSGRLLVSHPTATTTSRLTGAPRATRRMTSCPASSRRRSRSRSWRFGAAFPARWTSAPAAASRRSSPRSMPKTSSRPTSTHARSRLRRSTPN